MLLISISISTFFYNDLFTFHSSLIGTIKFSIAKVNIFLFSPLTNTLSHPNLAMLAFSRLQLQSLSFPYYSIEDNYLFPLFLRSRAKFISPLYNGKLFSHSPHILGSANKRGVLSPPRLFQILEKDPSFLLTQRKYISLFMISSKARLGQLYSFLWSCRSHD